MPKKLQCQTTYDLPQTFLVWVSDIFIHVNVEELHLFQWFQSITTPYEGENVEFTS